MTQEGAKLRDPNLYKRGRRISLLNRWIGFFGAAVALVVLWGDPRVHRVPTLIVGGVYLVYNLGALLVSRGRTTPWGPVARIAQNGIDAVVIGLASYLTGGLESPFWLLFYPHVVALSVRGGLNSAMVMGIVDAAIVAYLAYVTPGQPLGGLHAVVILWCAFMGGLMGAYLRTVQRSLAGANEELSVKNEVLASTVAAHEVAQRAQQQAIAQLSESEERYRRLLERIQEGVLIIQEGRIVRANAVFAEMAGRPAEGLVGCDFLELVPPEDRSELKDRYRRWELSQAVSGELESRVIRADGGMRLVSLRAGSVELEGKRSIIVTLRDITRERRMEQEVKGHAARLAAINEIANAVNLSLRIEDIFEVAAEETRRLVPFDCLTIALLGDGGGEVVSVGTGSKRRRRRFVYEDFAWVFRAPLRWSLGSEEPSPGRIEELLADPGVVSLATVPLLSKDRVVGSMNLGRRKPVPFSSWDLAVMEPVGRHIAIALDNARLFEAVRRRGGELESLLEIGRGILERHDLGGILPLVTGSVNRLMGTHACLLLLRSGQELELGAQEGLEAEVFPALKGLKVADSLAGYVVETGRPLFVPELAQHAHSRSSEVFRRLGYRSYLGVPLKREDEVLGALEVLTKERRAFTALEQELMSAFADQAAVAVDNARLILEARAHLSEMTAANARLEELDQLRQQYLRNVSHEFRTPLTVIKGYAEYVSEMPLPQDEFRKVMKVLTESCDRVIDMVDTLIEVSRIEQAGQADVLQLRSVDLKDLTLGSLEGLRPAAEKRRISLDLEFPGDPILVKGDRGLLHHLVRKLVDNAVKYSPDGARVVVRGGEEGNEVSLEVEDSGIGIAAEHLPRIFEKFYMVDGGITRRAGGTGVGLYLVKEIVRLHRGSVSVTSNPGKGSVFVVRLPRPDSSREQAFA